MLFRSPEDIRSLADLAAIPVTSRKDLQALEPADIVARGVNPARLLVHRTSGSSGEPLTIRRAWIEERIYVLIRLRALHALGLSPRDRQVVIGIVHPPDPMDVRRPQQILRAAGFYRKEPVDCRRPPEEIRDLLRRLRDRKSTRLNSSHIQKSRMPSSA